MPRTATRPLPCGAARGTASRAHLKGAFSDLRDAVRNAEPVHFGKRQRLQDQKIESSMQKIRRRHTRIESLYVTVQSVNRHASFCSTHADWWHDALGCRARNLTGRLQ